MVERQENDNLINVDLKTGLTTEEVSLRKDAGQVNKVSRGSSKTYTRIIFSNIFTFFNAIIATLVFLLIYVKAYMDILFAGVIVINTLIGIIQEIKAKRTIDKLSLLTSPVCNVIRDSEEREIKVNEIVINDLLLLNTGRQISADAIVREGLIEVDEALLTGESDLIVKKEGDYLYSGSYVASGACKAEVIRVGKDAYIESLTSKAKKYRKPNSELMNSLKYILRTITLFIIPIGILLFNMHYTILGESLQTSIRNTAGALVGMIPSGLFLLTSVALVFGIVRLLKKNTLVQELYCIELLARVDTLCLDKTGTITDGSMEVRGIIDIENNHELAPKIIVPQMMSAFTDHNQTNRALIEKFGFALDDPEVVEIINFSSANRYSAVELNGLGTFLIGSPETSLVKTEYNRIKTRVNKYAEQGLRVLVFAHSPNPINNGKIPAGLKPISLFLLEDKIRDDAPATIEYFKAQGVDLKVISGDNPLTVSNIAKRAGINDADKYISLEGLTNSEVVDAASKYQIFGRANPEQKEILIKAFKTQGRTVAMVGDGVNDILALREADASIAMAAGSEAARNASHIVMLDSNFSTMPKVVNEGRRVINNVQMVTSLFLTKTIFSILLTLIVLFAQIKYPFTTRQLFLINNAVIGVPSLILSLQRNFDIVKGNFLSNVLKRAFPGALAIVAQVCIILMVFKTRMNLTDIETSTLVVVSATFTGVVILYRQLKPFNIVRGIIFTCTIIFSAAALIFVPGFFEINALLPAYISFEGAIIPRPSFDVTIVLFLMLFSSHLFVEFFDKTPGIINRSVRWFFKRLSGV